MSTGAKYVAAASDEPSDEPIRQKRVGKTGAKGQTVSASVEDQRWMISARDDQIAKSTTYFWNSPSPYSSSSLRRIRAGGSALDDQR